MKPVCVVEVNGVELVVQSERTDDMGIAGDVAEAINAISSKPRDAAPSSLTLAAKVEGK